MVDWRFLSGGRDFIVCFWKLLSLNLERFLWLFSVFISTIFILFITTFLSWFRHLIRLAILLHDLVWENSLYFHEKSSKKTLKFPMFYPIFLWIKKMYFPSFLLWIILIWWWILHRASFQCEKWFHLLNMSWISHSNTAF